MLIMFYVYILETTSKKGMKRFYTGHTKDLYKRITQHRMGIGARYCRGKKRIELKYFETYSDRSSAMKREIEIKSLSRIKKLELIKNFNNG